MAGILAQRERERERERGAQAYAALASELAQRAKSTHREAAAQADGHVRRHTRLHRRPSAALAKCLPAAPPCSPMRQSWAEGTSAWMALGPKLSERATLHSRQAGRPVGRP